MVSPIPVLTNRKKERKSKLNFFCSTLKIIYLKREAEEGFEKRKLDDYGLLQEKERDGNRSQKEKASVAQESCRDILVRILGVPLEVSVVSAA